MRKELRRHQIQSDYDKDSKRRKTSVPLKFQDTESKNNCHFGFLRVVKGGGNNL